MMKASLNNEKMIRDYFCTMEKELITKFKRDRKPINDTIISEGIIEYINSTKGFMKKQSSIHKENNMFKANGSQSRSQVGSKSIDYKRKRPDSIIVKPTSVSV